MIVGTDENFLRLTYGSRICERAGGSAQKAPPHLVDELHLIPQQFPATFSPAQYPLARDAAHDNENARHLYDGCCFISISCFREKSTRESGTWNKEYVLSDDKPCWGYRVY